MKLLIYIIFAFIFTMCTSNSPQMEMPEKEKEIIIQNDSVTLFIGTVTNQEVCSKSIAEYRKITTYVTDKQYQSNQYIYFPDGDLLNEIAPTIDKMIYDGTIEPINLIGIHPKRRFPEYVKLKKYNRTFHEHLEFFTSEIPQFIEVDSKNVQRHIAGFSNGADFANYIGINKPKWSKTVFAMSGVAYFPYDDGTIFKYHQYPVFYLSSGKLEELSAKNRLLQLKLEELGATVQYQEHNGDHDYEIWKQMLFKHIEKQFNKCNEV